MKKNIRNIILILTICIILSIYLINTSSVPIFKIFNTESVASGLIDKALNGDSSCMHNIANKILNSIKSNQYKYDNTAKVQLCKANILSENGEDVLVAISLPPNIGIISILKPMAGNNEYNIYYTKADFAPIASIKTIDTPELPHPVIYIKEALDDKFGASVKSTIVEIYAWTGDSLEVIWSGTESYTSCWINISERNPSKYEWRKIDENAIISMNKDHSEIKVLSTQSYSETDNSCENIPDKNEFETVKARQSVSTYYLDSELKKYILGSASLNGGSDLYDYDGMDFVKKQELPAGAKVKLLQDLNLLADNLISNDFNYYKVLTDSGLTGYISKDAVSIK